jgi:hypothetical protein
MSTQLCIASLHPQGLFVQAYDLYGGLRHQRPDQARRGADLFVYVALLRAPEHIPLRVGLL